MEKVNASLIWSQALIILLRPGAWPAHLQLAFSPRLDGPLLPCRCGAKHRVVGRHGSLHVCFRAGMSSARRLGLRCTSASRKDCPVGRGTSVLSPSPCPEGEDRSRGTPFCERYRVMERVHWFLKGLLMSSNEVFSWVTNVKMSGVCANSLWKMTWNRSGVAREGPRSLYMFLACGKMFKSTCKPQTC